MSHIAETQLEGNCELAERNVNDGTRPAGRHRFPLAQRAHVPRFKIIEIRGSLTATVYVLSEISPFMGLRRWDYGCVSSLVRYSFLHGISWSVRWRLLATARTFSLRAFKINADQQVSSLLDWMKQSLPKAWGLSSNIYIEWMLYTESMCSINRKR